MSKTLHGRDLNDLMARFSASIDFDRVLFRHDIAGSRAHARMLAEVGLLNTEELSAIEGGLSEIEQEIAGGQFTFEAGQEDIHTHIENALTEKIGSAGAKLHAGRSRNDQIATDMRLWTREEIDRVVSLIHEFQSALVEMAGRHADLLMPGYTHLQRAMPITAGHAFLAYVEMLERDRGRLLDARRRANVSPLGSGALAGTTLPIDRERVASELGFDGITRNSLDAVSDRDFLLEFACALSLIATHLSRFSEELVNWTSAEFGFVRIGDAFSTGSSMMPQKRNPDALELVRGKTARVVGDLLALFVLTKGLPLSYNRDLQEDKERIFDAAATVVACLEVLAALVPTIEFNTERIAAAARGGFPDATALSEYLVRKGVPFRESHRVVARLVQVAVDQGAESLAALELETLREASERIEPDVYEILGAENALAAIRVVGGPAPARVQAEVERWSQVLRERTAAAKTER